MLGSSKASLYLMRLGYWALLLPVALLDSTAVFGISVFVFALSIMINPKATYLDGIILGLTAFTLFSWATSSEYGRNFIGTQAGAYFTFLIAIRFLYVCKDDFLNFVSNVPLYVLITALAVYIAAQVHVGYTYEVGTLEAIILIRLCISSAWRRILIVTLVAYMLAMFAISTRTTPLIVALVIGMISLINPPKQLLRGVYLSIIIVTPFLGYLLMSQEISEALSKIDDNAAIRYEFLKGATSMIGIENFILGRGFGEPYRDPSYDYLFYHPLLNDPFAVHEVSSHNSLFDIFYRFGIIGYMAFSIAFLCCLKLGRTTNRYYYILLFVGVYSLYSNAYLDSVRLAHIFAFFAAGTMFLINASKPLVPNSKQYTFNGSRFVRENDTYDESFSSGNRA